MIKLLPRRNYVSSVSAGQRRSAQVSASQRRGAQRHSLYLRHQADQPYEFCLFSLPLSTHLSPSTSSTTKMSAMSSSSSVCVPIAGLSAESSTLDICRVVHNLHTFHKHRMLFRSASWKKLYRCIISFSSDREYGQGNLAAAYHHYRLRTLYRLCGEGAPHPDEKPIKSRERTTKRAVKRRRQQLEEEEESALRDSPSSSLCTATSQPDAQPLAIATSPSSSHAVTSQTDLRPSDISRTTPSSQTDRQSRAIVSTPSSFSRYHGAHPETQSLTSLFSLYAQRCNPSHGADFDMCNLPEKRSRKPPAPSGLASLPEKDLSVPETVAPGYAECTRKSFDKVCEWLCEETPPHLRMGPDSVFLDVGSGYGKCVVQARIRANVRKSIGIEYVYVRYLMGMKMLTECIPSQFASIHARLGDSVELLQGDATDEQFVEQYQMATHVFMFDWVFNSPGKEGVAKLIDEARDLCVLISCQRPGDLPQFRKLHQMQLSTGKQHPTVYFYARCSEEGARNK
jgi:hypothetical protein